jgi:hypothetical protein
MRAESCNAVSKHWLAKNTSPFYIIANKSAKNSGATRANSTTADPCLLLQKRLAVLAAAILKRGNGDIAKSLHTAGFIYRQGLAETDC